MAPRVLLAARAVLVVAIASMLTMSGAAFAAGPLAEATVSLAASDTQFVYGTTVTFSGDVQSDPSCIAGRSVQLERELPGTTTWPVVATGTTADDGSFTFTRTPSYSADYRIELPESTSGDTTCDAAISNDVPVEVTARVTGTAPGTVMAGDCVDFVVAVGPNKAGDTVDVQRLVGTAWTTIQTLTLDATSHATRHACYRWADIGTQITLRALWPAQDALDLAGQSASHTSQVVEATWMKTVDQVVAGRAMSVSVKAGGVFLYRHGDVVLRRPASNEKLLQSMALLSKLGPGYRILTFTQSVLPDASGVIHGKLWLVGRGDPEVTYGRLGLLAQKLVDAGVKKVNGGVWGATTYFAHDWWATGWKPDFPIDEVALPSALTYQQNQTATGFHFSDPELRAAEALAAQLRARGVAVPTPSGAGYPPGGLHQIASILSAPLSSILLRQNFDSRNFYAEVLGKLLGVKTSGLPGTIAKAAAAIHGYAAAHGATTVNYDSSGLSYADRVTALGLVKLLENAAGQPWYLPFRSSLPAAGQGTLAGRLSGVQVHAKTGTLDYVSALSGYVYLPKLGMWGEFSILDAGMASWISKPLEDKIVRTLYLYGH